MVAKDTLVIKFGTASITTSQGEIDETVIADIAKQVAQLQSTFNIVLVSSGAVGAGKGFLKNYKGTLSERKAAAAIGNPMLLGVYNKYFQQHGITLAQSLCERHHFANREQFLQLKSTYQELWKNGIIPIANENDVVSNKELKFSDNDELATLIACGFGASHLLINTSVGGLLDANKQIIAHVPEINEDILSLVDTSKSATGLGGMTSKLNFTQKALKLGIKVVIFGMKTENGILKAMEGTNGTSFSPMQKSVSAHKKWLGTGTLINGAVQVDAGAEKALLSGKSLLAVGIVKVLSNFEPNEIIEVLNEELVQVAVAKCPHNSKTVAENIQKQNFEVANADQIVLV
jgi:glutamate 5-kinase